jgi:hypothetical protein
MMGIHEATFYNWKKKYGGLDISELRRLKQLVADPSLDSTSWELKSKLLN